MLRGFFMLVVAGAILSACNVTNNARTDWGEGVYSGAQGVPPRRQVFPQREAEMPVWLKNTDGYIGIGPSNGLGPGFGE